jgi:hypothetical protein
MITEQRLLPECTINDGERDRRDCTNVAFLAENKLASKHTRALYRSCPAVSLKIPQKNVNKVGGGAKRKNKRGSMPLVSQSCT